MQMDNPSGAAGAASEVELRLGDQSIATVPVGGRRRAGPEISADGRPRWVPATWSRSGSSPTVRFVPALEAGSKSSDTRELGVRVFHAFVQPTS